MKYWLDNTQILENLYQFLGQLDLEKGWVVEIKKTPRTLKQNDFYWKVLEELEKCTGQSKAEYHTNFKAKYLKPELDFFQDLRGKWHLQEKEVSTRDLNIEQFSEYLDKIFLEIAEASPDILSNAHQEHLQKLQG